MKKKKSKTEKKIPRIKKDIRDFLLSEEGKISKKDIVKLGISLAVLGMALHPSDSLAGVTHTNDFATGHTSSFASNAHTSFNDHSEHSVHANHSDGGWGC